MTDELHCFDTKSGKSAKFVGLDQEYHIFCSLVPVNFIVGLGDSKVSYNKMM